MSQVPFQLLEISLISAQDLASVSKNLRTFAVAWVNPERKLRTRVDQQGQINPTWNDKFVFRVDDRFLDSYSSAVVIEIYALGWLRDIPVGNVRVLINNLIPPTIRNRSNSSRRFVALQIRRPSGRPQGILNMGVSLLDNTMRSMPLYRELSISAVGYRDLIESVPLRKNDDKYRQDDSSKEKQKTSRKPQLRRTLSDKTDLTSKGFVKKGQQVERKGSSICNGSIAEAGSVRYGSVVDGGSVNNVGSMLPGGSMCSDVGPSPSVVAAAVARGLHPRQMAPPPPGSHILEDWTVEESSIEGLKSKIERWRMEVPPIYDHSYQKLQKNSNSKRKTPRRYTDGVEEGGGGGLFSCFGNAYGCEFSIVCGANGSRKGRNRSGSSKVHYSPEFGSSLVRS